MVSPNVSELDGDNFLITQSLRAIDYVSPEPQRRKRAQAYSGEKPEKLDFVAG